MRVGVLLAGCGLYDGSDPAETFLLLQALDEAGERPLLVAPDRPQARVVDHLTTAAEEGTGRSVLRESARLARQPVRSLLETDPEAIEALFIPGGYGAAINFQSGFAVPGAARPLHPEVERFLRGCLEAGKPIGTIGLGEVPLRALCGLDLPEGPSGSPRQVEEDRARRWWHTAGAASGGRLADVRAGIAALVAAVLATMQEGQATAVSAGERT
ncbi:MAG TPA: isoprenoid biosynthesis protein ElbB [Candidatus Polarisedimenticolia bacterium]|nr:isoprenoid biosynthesis protein ElbB [Candidatus Polarisedimenticolia bacterium]